MALNKGYAVDTTDDLREVETYKRINPDSKLEQQNGFSNNHAKVECETAEEEKKSGCFGKKKKTDEPQTIPVGPLEYFRFSDCLDRFLLILGILGGICHGGSMPLMIVLFGGVIDLFAKNEFTDTIINDQLKKLNISFPSNATIEQKIGLLKQNNPNLDMASLIPVDTMVDQMRIFSFYFIGIALGVALVAYLQVSLFTLPATRQIRRIRAAFFRAIMMQETAWFDLQKSGELNNRLTDDIQKVKDGMGDKIGQFFQWTASCIIGLVIGFVYGWKLTLVVLALSPLLAICGFMFSKLITAFAELELKSYSKAGGVAEEILGAIRTVAAFGGQKKEIDRYCSQLSDARKQGIKRGLVTGMSMGAVWFIIFCGYALAFWYGGKLIREDEDYTTGSIMIVFFCVLIAAMSAGHAAPSLEVFTTGRTAARLVYDIIDRVPLINSDSTEGLKPGTLTGNVELQDVVFSYPSRPEVTVLDGFSLKIPAGKTVALVGSSGCGKSSTVSLLQRFYDPNAGRVLIDGHDVTQLNVAWMRKSIGLVSQEPVLFACSIAENIRYGRDDVSDQEIVDACRMANAANFIEALPEKYNTLVGDRGTQLSGGQKQRIAIARALVRNPKILLLDEATSALDTESEAVVQAALDKARLGRTTVIVAHRLSTIRTADLIVGIANGKVQEMGTHDELMEKGGIYYTLCTNQTTQSKDEDSDKEDEEELDLVKDLEQVEDNVRKISRQRKMSVMSDESDKEKSHRRKSSVRSNDGKKKGGCFAVLNKLKGKKDDDLPDPGFGRLMSLNKPEWPFILLGCLGALTNGGVQPAFAIIFSEIIAVLMNPDPVSQEKESTFYCIMFVVLGVIGFISNFCQSFSFAKSGEELTMRCRQLMFKAMLRQDIAWFDNQENNLGAITTRLSTEATHIQTATGSRLGTVCQAIASLGVGIVIAFIYQWKLALVILAFVPFIMIGGLLQMAVMMGSKNEDKGALEEAGKLAVEGIECHRTVISLCQEQNFAIKYNECLEKPYRIALRKAHVQGLSFGLSMSIIFFCYSATFYYGAVLIKDKEAEMTDIFKVFGSLVFGAMAVGEANAFAGDAGKAKSSAARLFMLLDRVPSIDIECTEGKDIHNSGQGDVTFTDVRFRYPTRMEVPVLRGVSFTAGQSQTIALVGSSGCGKSTCIQLLQRFYDPLDGRVTINSTPLLESYPKSIRATLGLVQQEPILFSYSIKENIAYGDLTRDVPMSEIIEAARSANVHQFIEQLPSGYDTLVGEKGSQLSGGQKQRIAIARALVRNPKILLLDEATSALDTESEKIVQEALDRAQEGRTCVVIAHRLSTIRHADKIIVFHNGKVREEGTHDQLMGKKSIYYNLVMTNAGQNKQEEE